jgi:hypothetical protein
MLPENSIYAFLHRHLLAAAVNLARLAALGLTHTRRGWTLNPT